MAEKIEESVLRAENPAQREARLRQEREDGLGAEAISGPQSAGGPTDWLGSAQASEARGERGGGLRAGGLAERPAFPSTPSERPGVANQRPLARSESGVGSLSRADLGQGAVERAEQKGEQRAAQAPGSWAAARAEGVEFRAQETRQTTLADAGPGGAGSQERAGRRLAMTSPAGAPIDREGIEMLNRAIATEAVCALRYTRCAAAAKGIHSKGVAEEFAEHAQEEWKHLTWLAERVGQLGGDPNLDPAGIDQRSHCGYRAGDELTHMIEANLTAERQAVAMYRAMIIRFHDDPTTRRLLEKILAEEEEHADDLASLLEG